MQFKSTIILALTLLGLGLYVYYVDIPDTERGKKEKELSEKVISFEKNQVEEFTVNHSNISFTMKSESDGNWNMTEPVVAAGDKKNADGIVSRLNAVTFSRVVEENVKDLKKYGLEPPEATVSITIKGKKKKLLIGTDTPLGNGVYIKREWDDKILLAGAYIRDDLKKSIHDLRDKTVVSVKKEDVKELKIKDIVLSKNDDKWTIIEPVKTDGDNDNINSLINSIKKLSVKEFVDDAFQDIDAYGLAPAIHSIFLQAAESSYTLLIGKLKGADAYYAKRGNSSNIFLLKKDDVDKITGIKVIDLRDKKVFKIEKDEVDKIEIVYPDQTITLKRNEEKDLWQILSPIDTKANEVEVLRLLNKLESIEAKEFLSDTQSIKSPKIKITTWQKDGDPAGPFSVGLIDKSGIGIVATMNGVKSSFLMSTEDVDYISKTLFDLRDRRLISFNEEKVTKFEIKYPEKTFLLEKDKNEWAIVLPEKTKGNDMKIRVFLWNLRDVEFQEIIAEAGTNLAQYGLDKPEREIAVWEQGSKEPKRLFIGNRSEEKGQIYVQTAKDGKVYVINAESEEKIPETIDAFL